MAPFKPILILTVILQFISSGLSGQSLIYGTVRDQEGKSIRFANISVKEQGIGIITGDSGKFELNVPSNISLTIVVSCIGFKSQEAEYFLKPGEKKSLAFSLATDVREIDELMVSSSQERAAMLTRIDLNSLVMVPVSTGSVEALIKTLPGVSSNNELSSQYSVRGGNFDENLIYINDIEIYRPFLVRSGQQEGLSFINPDLVSSIKFSAGGFNASYGDKMSSVLDIMYRKPKAFSGSLAASLLGGSAHLEGVSRNNKFSFIGGMRYKSTRYLLGSLETSGDYKPKFIDFQGLITWNPSEKIEFSFLGNLAQNQYNFYPKNRNTDFGTASTPLNLKIYYEGNEKDQFDTYFGAITFRYSINSSLNLKIISSGFATFESETFDILGEYLINELDNTIGSTTYGDSILNIGIGGFLNHARNYLDAYVYSFSHIGNYTRSNHRLKWGLSYQVNLFSDKISEWDMVDSAGFSSPQNTDQLVLRNIVKARNNLISYKYSGFLQDTWAFTGLSNEYFFTAGLRAAYLGLNDQLLVSPRFLFSIKPDWEKDMMIHFSTGIYFQPPFYKEMRNPAGTINENLKAQSSIHILAGTDYIFGAWERPFKFTSEIYYKILDNIVPYKVDNVRIIYSGENMAKGYATGIDFKINGEFVKDAESWASLSFMQTREDIKGDSYGYYPRPTDQIMNFGLFFQDYLPSNPDYKVSLYFLYGSRLPYSSPRKHRYDEIYRLPPYRRVDLGFSKIIKKEGVNLNTNNPFRHFKSIWLGAEIFNLLGITNTVSYLWVQSVSNQQNIPEIFAIPNHLTGRQFNVKLTAKF